MVTVAIAILIVASLAIVGWPFMNPAPDQENDPGAADPALENLVVQREAAYAAIRDLEVDHTMGKLSDADYKAMRAKCEAKAVGILQQLDTLTAASKQAHPASEDSIESEVRRLRRGPSTGLLRCPKCGAAHTPGDAFCAKCGAALRGARCPNCGTRAALGDSFCARCGARIRA